MDIRVETKPSELFDREARGLPVHRFAVESCSRGPTVLTKVTILNSAVGVTEKKVTQFAVGDVQTARPPLRVPKPFRILPSRNSPETLMPHLTLPAVLTITALAWALPAYAQYADRLIGDRPSVGISSTTVGSKTLHLEQGVTFARATYTEGDTRRLATEQVLRLGLTERIEVQTALTFERNTDGRGSERTSSGLSQTAVGMRVALLEFAHGMPTVVLQSRLRLRAVSEDFRQPAVGNRTTLSAEHSVSDALSFGFNVAFDYDGAAAGPSGFYTVSTGYAPAERWATFFEVYGTTGDFDLNADAGVEYWITPDVKVDASAGWESFGSFKGDDPGLRRSYFLDAGVSWRFDWR